MAQPPRVVGKTHPGRRSCRVLVQIPVQVAAEAGPQAAFEEDTQTLVVNAHGALIFLAHHVRAGQILRLKNKISTEEGLCRVVYLGAAQGGRVQVGVEFTAPSPHFWHIAFPPEDWSAGNSEASTRHSR